MASSDARGRGSISVWRGRGRGGAMPSAAPPVGAEAAEPRAADNRDIGRGRGRGRGGAGRGRGEARGGRGDGRGRGQGRGRGGGRGRGRGGRGGSGADHGRGSAELEATLKTAPVSALITRLQAVPLNGAAQYRVIWKAILTRVLTIPVTAVTASATAAAPATATAAAAAPRDDHEACLLPPELIELVAGYAVVGAVRVVVQVRWDALEQPPDALSPPLLEAFPVVRISLACSVCVHDDVTAVVEAPLSAAALQALQPKPLDPKVLPLPSTYCTGCRYHLPHALDGGPDGSQTMIRFVELLRNDTPLPGRPAAPRGDATSAADVAPRPAVCGTVGYDWVLEHRPAPFKLAGEPARTQLLGWARVYYLPGLCRACRRVRELDPALAAREAAERVAKFFGPPGRTLSPVAHSAHTRVQPPVKGEPRTVPPLGAHLHPAPGMRSYQPNNGPREDRELIRCVACAVTPLVSMPRMALTQALY